MTISGGIAAGANLLTFAGSGATTISGTAAFSTSAGFTVASGAGQVTISAPVTLGAAQTWTNNSTTPVAINGAVTNSGDLLTLTGSGGGSISGAITGTGGLTVNGGTWTSSSSATTFSGAITIGAATLSLANENISIGAPNITVGNVGGSTGTLNLQSGTVTVASGGGGLFVGSGGSATGIVNQTGGTVTVSSNLGLLLGNSGGSTTSESTAVFNLSGGELTGAPSTAARGVMMGVNTYAQTTFNLSGTGNLYMPTAELAIGRNDSAQSYTTDTFNQTGGTASVQYLSIGGVNGATNDIATMTLTGGTFTAQSFQTIAGGTNSSAAITIGGTAQVTLPAFATNALGAGSTSTITFDGGTLLPYASSAAYMSGLTHAYLTPNGANINTNNFNITIAQPLVDSTTNPGGTLTKLGAGALTLTGANAYTGATTIGAGALYVDGVHGSATGYAGNYGVASGATLGGSGAINFATTATSGVTVAAGGIFVPGYNPANGAVSPANSTLSVTTNGGANGGTALTLAGSASQFDVSLTSGMAVTSFNGSSAPTGGYAFLNANGSIVNLDGLGGSSAGATLIVERRWHGRRRAKLSADRSEQPQWLLHRLGRHLRQPIAALHAHLPRPLGQQRCRAHDRARTIVVGLGKHGDSAVWDCGSLGAAR